MAADVRIPAVGESITTGTIAKWHQANGATVQQGDTLLTLETDKVSNDLEAESAGVLHILVDEGEEVEIGAVVATIDPAGGGAAPAPSEDSGGEPALSTSEAESAPTEESKNSAEGVSVSPTVRKFADEQGVDLTKVEGTGRKGFITKADVEAALTLAKEGEGARELTVFKKPVIEPKVSDDEGRFTRKKMSPLRRKIATHLVNAQQSAAILTTFNECDMTAVMNMRKTLQESFKAKYGIKLGFMSFFIKAAVEALKSVPSVNGRIDGDDMILNHYFDIGVAVGTERGLIVPVIRDCDEKGFAEIEHSIIDYANKARDGKIDFSDLQGGVFTISNGGVYGSMLSTPILNPPQSGILGMHTIQQRPVALNGKVVIRPMMYLALSYDHRIVDGKEAVTFLVRLKECIEDPTRLLVEA
ncbi:MAG: 2-oxoglutarate dehydrogenase complex dihydrolipoyllysine-residue succinyltransferase [Verrucomicrobiaceae bacterium]|nr:2-oxoglutarate dehydrogenase complex dihydrolipoyllysine-residue succinyltransferase [Verrucomicrobiaceae bacterium]